MVADLEVPSPVPGYEQRFIAFYEEEYARAARLAFALTGRRDLAEELAQDAFMAIYQDWGRFAAYDQPRGLLRRVLVNRCLSSGRRRSVEVRLLLRLGAERPATVELTESDEQLWAAVRSLPRRQAQAIALRYLDDLSVDHIAEVLGCSAETVHTHLRRGRDQLKRRLTPDA